MGRTKAHTAYKSEDGQRLKSVTTILNNLGWNKNVLLAWVRRTAMAGLDPDKVKEEAASIGTLAHHLCECHIKGIKPDTSEYGPDMVEKAENAFLGYLDWEKMTKPVYEAVELKMVSEKYRFGGTADFIARINGTLVLGDLKTARGLYPEMTAQLVAYRVMYLELQPKAKIESAMILRIDKENGSFAHHMISKYQLQWGWDVFKHCLALEELKKAA